eukprot:642005-Heterocapsa_arctica.AAC.1
MGKARKEHRNKESDFGDMIKELEGLIATGAHLHAECDDVPDKKEAEGDHSEELSYLFEEISFKDLRNEHVQYELMVLNLVVTYHET